MDTSILSNRLFIFSCGQSTADLLFDAAYLLCEDIEVYTESLAVSVCISKALDRAWPPVLINELRAYGISIDLNTWIGNSLKNKSIRIIVNRCTFTL